MRTLLCHGPASAAVLVADALAASGFGRVEIIRAGDDEVREVLAAHKTSEHAAAVDPTLKRLGWRVAASV